MAEPDYPVDWMKEDLKKAAKGDWESWFDPALEALKGSIAPPAKDDETKPVDFGGQKGELRLKFTGKDWGPKAKAGELKAGYAKSALTNLNEEVRRAYRDLAELNNNENKQDSFEVVGVLAFDEATTKKLGAGALLRVGDDGTFTTVVRSTVGDDDKSKARVERGKKFTGDEVLSQKIAVLFIRPDEPILEAMIADKELGDLLAGSAAANDAADRQRQEEEEATRRSRMDAERRF